MLTKIIHFLKLSLYAVLILAFAMILISYHPTDASLNTASSNPAQNYLGAFGAYMADIFMQTFGLGTWLFVLFAVAGFAFKVLNRDRHLFWLKRFVCVFLVFLFCLLCAPTDNGGVIGALLFRYLPLLPSVLVFILWCLFFAGLVFVLDVPVKLICEWVCYYSQLLVNRFSQPEELSPALPKPAPLPKKPAAPKPVQQKKTKAVNVLPSAPTRKKTADGFVLPSPDLLDEPKAQNKENLTREMMDKISHKLEEVLAEFHVKGNIVRVSPGPVVTLYEFEPAAGIKTSRVVGLADDLARAMSVVSVRMAVVPGTSVIGIELPNKVRQTVYIKEIINTDYFANKDGALPLILGKDIAGSPVIEDLAKMPHLLVAGTTGSGKSVGINTMILSLLYRFTPSQCRLIMVDPKMLELSVYNGIPHLLTPVVTEPGKAIVALKWTVKEMDDRYRAMATLGVRNIDGYNKKISDAIAGGQKLERQVQTGFDPETGRPIIEKQEIELKPLPYIVVIVDEMADLMLTAGKEVDIAVQRIAQKARASGIHLIMATQRPSVDVITGTIKANFPSRISFQVTSKIDSRTILGEQGAEQLLGRGDMLFMPSGKRPKRVHGPFVSDEEVERVVSYLKTQGEAQYNEAVTIDDNPDEPIDEGAVFDRSAMGGAGGGNGDLYEQAVQIVLADKRPTISYIQRKLGIGYNRAADLIDRMEHEGIVSAASPTGRREILIGGDK